MADKTKNEKVKAKSVDKVHGAAEVHQELEMVKGMLARTLADYDNLNKRVERERQDLSKIASTGIIVRLLPVLDNLEAAQIHLQDQGLAISIVEFKKVFSEEGLNEIKPNVGDLFDENIMEALEVVPGVDDNSKVTKVVLVGWKFNDGQVIRHAKVVVSKKFIVE